MVDPVRGMAWNIRIVQEEGTNEERKDPPPKRRRWRRRLVVLLVVLVAFLAWLNGPGIRWLGPKVAGRFLSGAGFEGSFTLDGSLLGGLSVHDVDLAGNSKIRAVSAGSIRPLYRITRLVKGEVDGIEIDGLHVELQLDAEAKAEGEEKKPEETRERGPTDLRKVVGLIRSIRARVLPVAVRIEDVSLDVTKDGQRILELAPSDITHDSGGDTFLIKLGAITDATGNEWPAQTSTLVWNEDSIELDRLEPLPSIAVGDLRFATPESGEPSAELDLQVDEGVFDVALAPGFKDAVLQLREGRLRSGPLLERFGIEVPASAELSSFSATVDGLLPAPMDATGEIRLMLENVVSGEWSVPELSLDAKLGPADAEVAARGMALGSEFTLRAALPVNRAEDGFLLGNARGSLRVAEVPKVVASLAEKFDAIDKEAGVPESHVEGNFTIDFDNNRPAAADATIVLQPAEPEVATAVTIEGGWKPDQPVAANVKLDGFAAEAGADLERTTYQAKLTLDGFDSRRVARWLAIAGVDPGGNLAADASWNGRGNWTTMEHTGRLALPEASFAREGTGTIDAAASAEYEWPGRAKLDGLRITSGSQVVATDVLLADGWVELTELDWKDGENPMAFGTVKLPVPGDFSKWRDTLANDDRPLAADLRTEVLALRKLSDWVPVAGKINPGATGQVLVEVSGTYAEPAIDAVIELKDLRVPEKPELPPADLKLTIAAKENHFGVVGNLATPEFEPAVLTASIPFHPSDWAENPDLIRDEPLTARLDLPRVTLDRFAKLAPALEKLSGVFTGGFEVAGTVAEPDIKGHVELNEVSVALKGEKFPPVENAGLTIDFVPDKVELKNLRATIAGGTLSGGGTLALDEWTPGDIDIRINGKELPVVRNASTIVRTNLDVRLAGPFEEATLSGSVNVIDSLFYQDIELIPIGVPFTGPSAASLPKVDPPDEKAAKIPDPFGNWKLDLRVRTAEPFLIRGNLASGEVDVDLRIGGTAGDPAPDGSVRLRNITALLPFSTVRVKEGWVRFKPESGLDPLLEIRATANPKPYRANAFVYGSASNPQLALTSSPPLPENEIMTLLATGTTTSGLEDPQMASSRAIQLLIEELRRGRLGGSEKLRPVLSVLDRVEFSLADKNPYTSETFSSATIAVTDKWFLAASMGEYNNTRLMGLWRLTFR